VGGGQLDWVRFATGGDLLVGVVLGQVAHEHLIEHGGFEAAGAAQAPAGLGHLLDQEGLVLVGGMELIAEAGEEDVEFVLVLVREDGEGSGEPVPGGVPSGCGFPSGVFGPVECVAFC
jgi:hypothetical protein